jgi:hypothetical protein
MIRATVEMTQKVRLADIKVIYGDGILGRGKLLEELDIIDTCRVVWTTNTYLAMIMAHGRKNLDELGPKSRRIVRCW